LIWLLPILTWNLLALNLGLTAYVFIGAYFEERKLLLEFGESYAEYRKRTPMLIPGLKLPHSSDKSEN
jgi:protein-S-isoprenylcysteine O-methyltransferase Ste14